MENQKQNKGIGKLLTELRQQEQISEEELSQGLCSLTEFRKIETGERAVSKTLLDALLGRMGRAADNFSIVLEKEQYQMYELRNQIQKDYLAEKTEQWKEGMKELREKLPEKAGADYQFYCKMKFLMGDYLYKNLKEMERILVRIIKITIPQFTIQKVSECYLCMEEISLCCLLASMYQAYGENEKARMLLENLIACVEKRYQDTEEKVRIYPQIAILLLRIYDVWKDNDKWISLCQRTIDLLSENGTLTLMEELLECYKIGLEEKIQKSQRKFNRLEETVYHNICRGLECIQELNREYGISYNKKGIIVSNHGYYEVYLLQEMILDYRIRAQKSQSQLGEALGIEWETVSRYENGWKKPSRKTYQILAEKIGIQQDKYGIVLPVGNYIVYEKIRQVERYLLRNEFQAAEQLFLEIEPLIPKERAENRQYCLRTRAILDFFLHGLSEEEKLKKLEEAMRYTLPGYHLRDENFLKYHIPSRYETILLNNIAASYGMLGQNEKAEIIFKAILTAYQTSKVHEEYHLMAVTLTRVNYIKYVGLLGRYDEALEIIEKTLKMNLQFGKGNMIPYLIYSKGWNILKKEGNEITKEKRNACMKYYQQAYWISGFMNNFILQQSIEKLYEKDFSEKLV